MDRRRFLVLTAGGVAGACQPASAFAPSRHELLTEAVHFGETGYWSAFMACGKARGFEQPLQKAWLEEAIGLYRQAMTIYEEAMRLYPNDVVVLEHFAHASMEMSRVEVLKGVDARDRIADGLRSTEEWVRLSLGDSAATRSLAYHRSLAERLFAISREPMPGLLTEDIIYMAYQHFA